MPMGMTVPVGNWCDGLTYTSDAPLRSKASMSRIPCRIATGTIPYPMLRNSSRPRRKRDFLRQYRSAPPAAATSARPAGPPCQLLRPNAASGGRMDARASHRRSGSGHPADSALPARHCRPSGMPLRQHLIHVLPPNFQGKALHIHVAASEVI